MAISSDPAGRPEPSGRQHPAAEPVLVVNAQGNKRTLLPGLSYRVGRNPQSDIVLADSRVSWDHAILEIEDGAWFIEDCGNTSGTFVDGHKISRCEITRDCTVRFGHAVDGPAVFCSPSRPSIPGLPVEGTADTPGGQAAVSARPHRSRVDVRPTAIVSAPARTLRIGRGDDNDIVLADLSVSRHHAELRNAGGRHEIVDLGSHNGTFLNGSPIIGRAVVTGQDIIGIGQATFRLADGELREFVDQGDVSLVAQDLTVRVGTQILIDQVSFPIGERSLVAVIGPSGSGKTTLLNALTGLRPATEGTVLYDSRDLYSDYAELRHRIGLVPQEDVIYPELTPRRFLGYAAELRFPGDTSADERSIRVQEVIEELKLTHTTADQPEPPADRRSAALSGGQKKRVSIALELLTKPSVLFLDEPTSSLDVELKEDVVDSMKELTRTGRTVIMVTHDLEYLDKCDRVLVLMPGGKMAFYGPCDEGLQFFGKARWVEVYRAFREESGRDWAGEFRRSPGYQRYVASGLTGRAPRSDRAAARAPTAPRSRIAQLSILSRRYAALIAANRSFLIWLLALPVVLGLLVRASAGGLGFRGPVNTGAEQTLLILVIIAAFTGGFSSVQELVKERDMYRRERTAGLSTGAYVLSKVAVLGLITSVQAALLVIVGLAFEPMPRHGAVLVSLPLIELIVDVAILAVASMTLGLVVSAWVSSQNHTLTVLMVLSLAQVMLSGALIPLKTVLKLISYLAPARWGFAAAASTVDLNAILPRGSKTDSLWAQKPPAWLLAIGLQVVLAVVFTLVAWWKLIRADPGRIGRPGRNRTFARARRSASSPVRR
jgi:ABC transport system ATP-binding/permease protein